MIRFYCCKEWLEYYDDEEPNPLLHANYCPFCGSRLKDR